jgi:hypothetical protein
MLGFKIINGIVSYYLTLLIKFNNEDNEEQLVEFDIIDCTILIDDSEIGFQFLPFKLISSETGLAIYFAEQENGDFMLHGNTETIVNFVNSLSKNSQKNIMNQGKFIITKATGYTYK